MKWAHTIQQKTKIAFWSTLVLVLIFAKNWMDKSNVITLDHSFASVYDDRLVAESYIFQLSDHLYQKKITISSCYNADTQQGLEGQIKAHHYAIAKIISDFEKTKLTPTESMYFGHLKENLSSLNAMEDQYLSAISMEDSQKISGALLKLQESFDVVLLNLNQLSKIQLSEGQLLKEQSKQIAAGSTLLTQFELVVIVGIGILIQILIFASRSNYPKVPQKFNLN